MSAAIFSIGTELTRGEIVNTNAAWLSDRLTAMGFDVTETTTVDDDIERVGAALARLAREHSVIVATGGLGPTTDDLTAVAVAKVMGVGLRRDADSIVAIQRRFASMKRIMSPSNEKQADFPEGAETLPNPVGTAPGFAVLLGQAKAFFLPGVPHEMKRLFDDHVVGRIAALAPNYAFQIRIKTYGMGESLVGEKLSGIEQAMPEVILGYRAHIPEIEVKVLAHASSHEEARAVATRAAAEVRGRLGAIVYGEGDDTLVGVTAQALRRRGYRLAIAESCTGGLVSHLLTEQPASDYLLADVVTYANEAKVALLGVGAETLRQHGAVSREVAEEMAQGVRRVTGAEVGLSITGIAGPSGGTTEKPVGLVHWAVSHPGGTVAEERVFLGQRGQIQLAAAHAALALVRSVC